MIGLISKSIFVGAGTGFLSGLTGMGGGVILVPVFYLFYAFPIKQAIGTSLSVIVFTAISALLSHAKSGKVDLKIAAIIILFGIVGAQAGALLTCRLPDSAVKTVFLLLVGGLGYKMWFEKESLGTSPFRFCVTSIWKIAAIGFAGGFVSGMGGIGGAVLLVPLLHLCLGVTMNVAIATTLAAVFCNALSGSIGYFGRGFVDFHVAFLVALGSVPAAPFGARLSMKLPQKTLRRIFAGVLILAGISVLVRR
jgi:uncharacterized membrane protein YfcA